MEVALWLSWGDRVDILDRVEQKVHWSKVEALWILLGRYWGNDPFRLAGFAVWESTPRQDSRVSRSLAYQLPYE